MKSKNFLLLQSLLLFLFIGSCNTESLPEKDNSPLPHEALPFYTTTLKKVFNDKPDHAEFNQILHAEMNIQGDFFITDVIENKIYKYNTKGDKISVFQRFGNGPGEFQSMNFIIEDELNQAAIYDPLLSRLTIMDSNLEQDIQIISVDPPQGISLELLGFTETGVYFKGSKGFGLHNYQEKRDLHIYFQEFQEEKPGLIFSVPLTEYLPIVNQQQRSIFLEYMPFGRRTSLSKQGDEFIFISNDGFGYTTYGLNGHPFHSDSLPNKTSPYSLNQQQVEKYISRAYSGSSLSKKKKEEVKSKLRNAVDLNNPVYFQNSFADVQGRLWFELYSELFENESRWIVWKPESEETFQVIFDEDNVRPQNAFDDTIVAFKRNEFDLETVRIYTIIR